MFETPEQMQEGIDAYFDALPTDSKPTISGLCYSLGFVDRGALAEYEKKPEFSRTVKGARIRVEQALEEHLYGGQVTGVIFNLKNNFGWKDKTEVDARHGFMTQEEALDDLA